jgi:[ribosomal protein S18]-alanine N-acetyltransferase
MEIAPSIRAARRSDLSTLIEIERQSFADPSWPTETFLKYRCLVAEMECQVAGFLVSRETFAGTVYEPPEREILNLAVTEKFRRLGIATFLLRHELQNRAVFFLEVRESNVAARALYRKLGFAEVGRRPRYYRYPVETAIVMKMKWC